MKIVLKHLAQEFKADPRVIRAILREQFKPIRGRWQWDTQEQTQQNQLQEIRSLLGKRLFSSHAKSSLISITRKPPR